MKGKLVLSPESVKEALEQYVSSWLRDTKVGTTAVVEEVQIDSSVAHSCEARFVGLTIGFHTETRS